MQQLTNLSVAATNGTFKLQDLNGKNVVLYFYPKDNTSGCSLEAQDFAANYDAFLAANTCVFGISRDSLKKHQNFQTKLNLPFALISDFDEKLCNIFEVIKPKKLYGREYLGIERSTFLFDVRGNLVREWRKVKIKGHALEVLQAAQNLNNVNF